MIPQPIRNNPQIVIYVAIDNPKGISAYGGTVSATIFKNIAEDAITALKIKKPEAGLEKEYRYFDIKYYTVEDVVGMNVEEAKELLKKFRIEYSGTGNKVVDMSPNKGSRIPEGSVVRLMMSKWICVIYFLWEIIILIKNLYIKNYNTCGIISMKGW